MEPELKPEFIEKAQEIMNQEPIDVGTVESWKKCLTVDLACIDCSQASK